MKRRIRLTEGDLHRIVKESVNRILKEGVDPISKVQSLIQQANNAYHEALEAQDNYKWPLMNKRGETYGLSSDVKLDGRGYVSIPYTNPYRSFDYQPVKIRVISKVGGRLKIIPGDYWEEGWKDVKKMLNNIIRDAEIGNNHMRIYDPSVEDSSSPQERRANKERLKGMNREIGRNVSAGMEYV